MQINRQLQDGCILRAERIIEEASSLEEVGKIRAAYERRESPFGRQRVLNRDYSDTMCWAIDNRLEALVE